MRLETMQPDPGWVPAEHEEAVGTLRAQAEELTVHVWGGDWCKDCQAVLPTFAAALDAAGIDPSSTKQYPVEKKADGSKEGPKVEAYDIQYIPTIVLERDGVEQARFVEKEDVEAATYLARQLATHEPAR